MNEYIFIYRLVKKKKNKNYVYRSDLFLTVEEEEIIFALTKKHFYLECMTSLSHRSVRITQEPGFGWSYACLILRGVTLKRKCKCLWWIVSSHN